MFVDTPSQSSSSSNNSRASSPQHRRSIGGVLGFNAAQVQERALSLPKSAQTAAADKGPTRSAAPVQSASKSMASSPQKAKGGGYDDWGDAGGWPTHQETDSGLLESVSLLG